MTSYQGKWRVNTVNALWKRCSSNIDDIGRQSDDQIKYSELIVHTIQLTMDNVIQRLGTVRVPLLLISFNPPGPELLLVSLSNYNNLDTLFTSRDRKI